MISKFPYPLQIGYSILRHSSLKVKLIKISISFSFCLRVYTYIVSLSFFHLLKYFLDLFIFPITDIFCFKLKVGNCFSLLKNINSKKTTPLKHLSTSGLQCHSAERKCEVPGFLWSASHNITLSLSCTCADPSADDNSVHKTIQLGIFISL